MCYVYIYLYVYVYVHVYVHVYVYLYVYMYICIFMLYAYATVFDTLQITIASIDNLDIIGCDCILHSHILG